MAVQSDQVTVGTSATSVLAAGLGGLRATVRNAGANPVTLGPSGVTTSTGLDLAAGDSVEVELNPGDELYGIVGSGSERVDVLAA